MIDQRTAILKAADSIEAHPEWFEFVSSDTPDGCGKPGCALGWIAHHVGVDAFTTGAGWRVYPDGFLGWDYLGVSDDEFYGRMGEIAGGFSAWAQSPDGCAKALRLYADKYFPATAEIIELRAA